jgi:hypothetical protein
MSWSGWALLPPAGAGSPSAATVCARGLTELSSDDQDTVKSAPWLHLRALLNDARAGEVPSLIEIREDAE